MQMWPRWIKFTDREARQTILNPVEQRIYGLIHVFQGITMIIFGKHSPSMILPWIMNKSVEHNRKKS